MRITTMLLIFLFLITAPLVQAYFEFNSSFFKDTDNLVTLMNEIGYKSELGKNSFAGIFAGYSSYNSPTYSKQSTLLRCSYDKKINDKLGLSAGFGGNDFNDGQGFFPFYNTNMTYAQTNNFRIEASLEHNLIETAISIENKTTLTTGSLFFDFPVYRKIILTAGTLASSFSDGNYRQGIVIKGIFPLFWEGTSLQLLDKTFNNSKTDTTGYFNPTRIEFQRLLFSARKAYKGFRLYFLAGPGLQKIDEEDYTNTLYLETSIEKYITEYYKAGFYFVYSDSAYDLELLRYNFTMLRFQVSHPF